MGTPKRGYSLSSIHPKQNVIQYITPISPRWVCAGRYDLMPRTSFLPSAALHTTRTFSMRLHKK